MSEGSGPGASSYLVAVCEGRRCVGVFDFDDVPGGPPTEAEAIAVLARVAAHLREAGALGRAVLLDRRTKAVVAKRRVWP